MSRQRSNWRALALFLAFAALWWFVALAIQCDLSKPRPTELIPAEQRERDKAE